MKRNCENFVTTKIMSVNTKLLTGLYLHQISYWLNSKSAPKNFPKNKKFKSCKLTYLPLK